MKIQPLSIKDVILIEMDIFEDERGFFLESYNKRAFEDASLPTEFVQDNCSGSQRGVLRGLHYQIQNAQGKLIGVNAGEIFDVAVDLRRKSPTFGKWTGSRLNSHNKSQLWVPAGFGHGFYVLSDWAEIRYKTTDFYSPESERTILWNDPSIGINWPIHEGGGPFLSEKDKNAVYLSEAEIYN